MGRKNWRTESRVDALNSVKFVLARSLERVQLRQGYTRAQFALNLGTTESRLAKIFNKHVEDVSIDRLVLYLIIAEPLFQLQVAI